MGLSVGTLVRPFVDASYFVNEDETNFRCKGDKTDICIGIITNFDEFDQTPVIHVKWLQKCTYHFDLYETHDSHAIDDLWEIGQVY